MGKPKRERSLADNEALAVATLLRTSRAEARPGRRA